MTNCVKTGHFLYIMFVRIPASEISTSPQDAPYPAAHDERPPWEEPAARARASAPAPSPDLPPEPDAVSSATPVVNGPDRGIEDMNANLAAGFGDGVSFEEVV